MSSVGVLGALMTLAACSSDVPEASRFGGSDDPEPGILRVGLERPQSLDPAQARSPAELLVAEQLFDSLTGFDPATSAVVPAVAVRWEMTPDLRKWTFQVRPGARFANGRAITADDVVYSLERIAKKGSSSPSVAQLAGVVGFRAFNVEGVEHLAGVKAVAPDVVQVELDQPEASLPAILGHPTFAVVPREAVEATEPSFALQPVGSGPFVIGSRTDELLRMVPAPGTVTELKGLDLRIVPDTAAAYQAFQDGHLDWTSVPADRVEQVVERRGREGARPYLGQLFYGFNLRNPKYADARFREAIVRAIDRDAIVRLLYAGSARRSDGLLPEGVAGFAANACGDRCRYDPERARALANEVFGEAPVPEVQIDFDDDGTQQGVAQAMQANLRAAGIPAALRPHPFADYLKFAISGNQELFRLGWIGAYPAADAFLTPLFQTGRTDNVTGFSSGAVDGLLKAGRSEADDAKRVVVYGEAEKLVLEQLPVVPLAQFDFHSLTDSRVSGLVVSGFGTFDATRVKVA